MCGKHKPEPEVPPLAKFGKPCLPQKYFDCSYFPANGLLEKTLLPLFIDGVNQSQGHRATMRKQ